MMLIMRPSEQANRDVEDRGLDTEQLRRLRDKLAKLEAAADVDPEQIGPYTVEARLGGGAMGRVYRCREEGELPRLVAVKLMKAGLGSEAVLRFSQECEALAKVDDPNVARVFAADVCDDGRPYVAMELIEGQTNAAYCDG
jgi:serine/threonine-protein kinase